MSTDLDQVTNQSIGPALRRLGASLVALLFLLPIVWAVSASLRETGVPPPRTIDWIPMPVAWQNYQTVFELVDGGQFALNSLLVAAAAVPLTILSASLAGFAISQISHRWRLRLLIFSTMCLMVPLTAVWLPRFILFKEAGLINHRSALVVPALMGTSPFYVMLFVWAYLRVPREIYEAARLDGAGSYRIWAGIGLPLVRPAVVSVAVLAFVHYWNSFVEPLLYIRTEDKFTASLGLRVLYQLDRTNWPIIMSGALLMIVPVFVVFVVAQRAFLQDARGHGLLGR